MNNVDLQKTTNNYRPPIGTLILLVITVLFLSIFVLWAAGIPDVANFFERLAFWQGNSPLWLQVPTISSNYLLIPTVVLSLAVLLITKFFSEKQFWARLLVVSILLVLMGRYVLWRSLSSLNLDTPLNGFFSFLLLFVELYFTFRIGWQAFLSLKIKDRRQEAETNALAVESGKFTPTVDILIPTYNESAQIIQRTVIGCQALEYPHKKIYVLDDTRREEIKYLAQKLGCEYMTRPDNKNAKAGNLNNAIAKTSGELIVVFDVDFIPNKNFLTRTVGFFQDPQVGFLQTSQGSYNPDLLACNLGLSDVLPHAAEDYYNHYQLLRDGVDCTGCYGSSVVFNRKAIAQIGGFVTTSLSEDYFTGISISAQGYKSIYLNEKLSAGLGAENMDGHITQRLRWSRGTLQGFFIKENPCTIPGLKLIQRITHLEEVLLSWMSDLPRLFLLLTPFLYTLGIIPIKASLSEIIYFLLPYYLSYFTAYTWLYCQTQSFLISDIYLSIHCIPLSLNFIKVMLNPFGGQFKVTPKGIFRDTAIFYWDLALPLIGLLALNLVSFSSSIFPIAQEQNQLTAIAVIWSAYNLLFLGCIIASLVDAPKASIEWFKLSKLVAIKFLKTELSPLSGTTTEMSEFGIKVSLDRKIGDDINRLQQMPLLVEFKDEQIELTGELVNAEADGELIQLHIMFVNLSLEQQRYLVETLFCTPHQWHRRESPGDLQILWFLLKNAAMQIKKYSFL